MSRIEENADLINKMMIRSKENPDGTPNEQTVFNIGLITSLLTDISKSLAVIADKVESENK